MTDDKRIDIDVQNLNSEVEDKKKLASAIKDKISELNNLIELANEHELKVFITGVHPLNGWQQSAVGVKVNYVLKF